MTTKKARDAAERVVALCSVVAEIVDDDVAEFERDVRAQWAVEMGLIRIGEAVNRIPDEVRTRFPEQPWRTIVAMRELAAQQYDDLVPRRVWRTATQDVPGLRAYLADAVIPGLEI